MKTDNYTGYKNLPELVGLHTMKDAQTKGLTVLDSVNRLKRYHWTAKRLSLIFTSRITAMPVYELKMAFGLHAHYMAEHVEPFFNRVREMRQPPYGMDNVPHPSLDILLNEIQNAPSTEELLLGLYEVVLPAFTRGLKKHIAQNNKLFDHPTFRLCRFALTEFEEIEDYGKKAVACFIDQNIRSRHRDWLKLLQDLLDSMGDLDGTLPEIDISEDRKYSLLPFKYDGHPARDERFKDVYNMGVNAEAFLLNPDYEALPKTIMLYFKRMREIDVPEMMSSIITETSEKPWLYYKDMIRQLWDESRHAMMGEIGFTSLGIDWKQIPFNITWAHLLNTKMNALERHAILYYIEQGLMPAKTGKQYEWEVAVGSASKLSQLIQDYDWADEVLHAKIGRDWLVPELGGQNESMEFGNKCWSIALNDSFNSFEREKLTAHKNWWPEVYKMACENWGIQPDASLLKYDTSYRESRPDQVVLEA